jgi:hypothetical protein
LVCVARESGAALQRVSQQLLGIGRGCCGPILLPCCTCLTQAACLVLLALAGQAVLAVLLVHALALVHFLRVVGLRGSAAHQQQRKTEQATNGPGLVFRIRHAHFSLQTPSCCQVIMAFPVGLVCGFANAAANSPFSVC